MKIRLLCCIFFILLCNISYAKEYKAYVHRVIDGDTIECTLDLGFGVSLKDKIRFLDYDAPETFRPKTVAEKLLGDKAKSFLKEKINEKFIIINVPKKERGKYGRILGIIYYQGVNINELMKERGFVK